MIDLSDPLSALIWCVFFVAAGLYPLGIMLPCSPCCGGGGEGGCATYIPFKKCARFTAVEQTPRPTAFTQTGVGGSSPATYATFTTFPVYTHGFSRSITRPEAIGAVRVPAFASAAPASVGINVSDTSVSQHTVQLQSLYGFGTPNLVVVPLYTWTVVLDDTASEAATEIVNDTSAIVRVARPANNYPTLTVTLEPHTTVAPPDEYLPPIQTTGNYYYTSATNVWSDYVRLQVLQANGAGGFVEVEVDTSVSSSVLRYVVRVSDITHVGSQDWVVDKDEVDSFLAGNSSLRYVDGNGKQWDVEVGEPHPACGWPIGVGAFANVIQHVVTADLRVCDANTQTFALRGCLPTAPASQQPLDTVPALLGGLSGWGRVGEWVSVFRYIQTRLFATTPFGGGEYLNSFPYVRDGASTTDFSLYPSPPAFGDRTRNCSYRLNAQVCGRLIGREIPSEAFFCGDILWVMENGPCAESLTLNYTDGVTETYTLGGQEDNHQWSRCILTRNGVVSDYPSTWDGKCWPNTATVTLGWRAYRRNSDGTYILSQSGDLLFDTVTTFYECTGTLRQWSGSSCAYASECVGGEWVAVENPRTVEVYSQTCNSAMVGQYALYGSIARTCGGDVVYTLPTGTSWVYLVPLAELGSQLPSYCQSLADAGYYGVVNNAVSSVQLDGPFTDAARLDQPTVSPDILPQEGGTVTLTLTQAGVGTVTEQVSILPNPLRQQRTVLVEPSGVPTRTANDTVISVTDRDVAWLPVRQTGTGGIDDSQCRVDMNWMNATLIDTATHTVFADFVDERCLVGLPAAVDGDTCQWSISTAAEWLAISVNETSGLVTITIDGEADLPEEEAGAFYYRRPRQNYGGWFGYGYTTTLTVGNATGEVTWTVKICTRKQ